MKTYLPFIKPIAVNGYAVIIATGKAGKIGNKYRDDYRKITWGIDWASEYPSSELCRITPAEFHALPDYRKITEDNRGEKINQDWKLNHERATNFALAARNDEY